MWGWASKVNNLTWYTQAGSMETKQNISKALSLISSPALLRQGECDNKNNIVVLSEGSDSKKEKNKNKTIWLPIKEWRKKVNNNDDGTITTTSNNMNQYVNVEYWKYYAYVFWFCLDSEVLCWKSYEVLWGNISFHLWVNQSINKWNCL